MVIGGYAAALFVASAAVYVHQLHTQDAQAQASSGMYAFGDLLLFIAVFGVAALFPTGLALYFLRPFEKFWAVLSVASLAVAVTGLCAALVIVLSSAQSSESLWNILAAIGVLRVLLAPPLATVFALSAWAAPNRRAFAAAVAYRDGDRGLGGRICLHRLVRMAGSDQLFSRMKAKPPTGSVELPSV